MLLSRMQVIVSMLASFVMTLALSVKTTHGHLGTMRVSNAMKKILNSRAMHIKLTEWLSFIDVINSCHVLFRVIFARIYFVIKLAVGDLVQARVQTVFAIDNINASNVPLSQEHIFNGLSINVS